MKNIFKRFIESITPSKTTKAWLLALFLFVVMVNTGTLGWFIGILFATIVMAVIGLSIFVLYYGLIGTIDSWWRR